MPRATRIIAIAVLTLIFLGNVYRASTQSVTHDEAMTYRLYIAAPLSVTFTSSFANNHFLATLLTRLSVKALGLSELALRLPSVLSGALFLFVIYQLSLLVFGEGLFFLLSVLLLASNPLILDFLVAARGYGPALAFFVYALYCLLTYATKHRFRRTLLYQAALGLSCSVASNMAFVVPAFAVAAIFLLVPRLPAAEREQKEHGRRKRTVPAPSRLHEVKHFIIPVIVCALLYLWLAPFPTEGFDYQYAGSSSSGGTAENVSQLSFAHNDGLGGINRPSQARDLWLSFLTTFLMPAVVGGGLLVALGTRRSSAAHLLLLWSSGCAALSLLLFGIAHHFLGTPYPSDRTGLSLVALVAMSFLSLAFVLWRMSPPWRFAALPVIAACVLMAAQQLVQYNWTHFNIWRYDADTRDIIEKLRPAGESASAPLRLGISWQLSPSINYYIETRELQGLQAIYRSKFDGDFDYFVIIPNDQHVAEERNLTTLYTGPLSGTILAKPRSSAKETE